MKPVNSFQWQSDERSATYRMWYSPDKIGRAFASGSLYERPFLDWIYEQQFTGTALDVGANIGNHSLWMHFVCNLDVVAFEPVIPHVVRANAHLNGVLNRGVWVYDFALGDVPGVGYHVAKGEISRGKSKQSTDETFEIKRLDSLDMPHDISFIKIDVEGHEPNVLAGGVQLIQAQRPVIATEEWTPLASKKVGDILRPLGYRPAETFGGKGRAPMVCWRPE